MSDTISNKSEMRARLNLIRSKVSLYQVLCDAGSTPKYGRDRPSQVRCIFNHPRGDVKPSARYYPQSDRGPEGYLCFYCLEKPVDIVGMTMKLQGISFFEAVKLLEKKANIHHVSSYMKPDMNIDDFLNVDIHASLQSTLNHFNEMLIQSRDDFQLKTYLKMVNALDVMSFSQGKKDIIPYMDKWSSVFFKTVKGGTYDDLEPVPGTVGVS